MVPVVRLSHSRFVRFVAPPLIAGGRRDNADQLLGGLAQYIAELQQPLAFCRLRVNLSRDTGAENLVLRFQIFDVASLLTIC